MDVFDKESKLTENMFDGSFNKKKRNIVAKIIGIIAFIKKQKGNSSYYQFNTLISITSYDRSTINSMNVIEGVSPIEDINYEIWFFYNHS